MCRILERAPYGRRNRRIQHSFDLNDCRYASPGSSDNMLVVSKHGPPCVYSDAVIQVPPCLKQVFRLTRTPALA
ncbi:hypothetical protein Tamer19_67060 [Cupriavidus sp. TA19]|nr:hypothetical protein Tamer19_67060 [Cupriavidus sp. TA19]